MRVSRVRPSGGRKFQWGARLPSLREAARVLLLDGGNPDDLLRLVTFSLLVGNTDMHAKSISFLRHPDGRVELSPAYDIAMHLHHARDNRRFALDLNARHRVDQLSVDDVIAEGVAWGLPERRARRVAMDTTRELAEALDALDRAAHPDVSAAAWAVVEQRTEAALDLSAHLTPAARKAPGPTATDVQAPSRRRRGPRRPR